MIPALSSILAQLTPLSLLLPHWVLIFVTICLGGYFWVSYWPGRDAKVKAVRASSFSPNKVPPNLDTIVIGSGSGGSSCANILVSHFAAKPAIQLPALNTFAYDISLNNNSLWYFYSS